MRVCKAMSFAPEPITGEFERAFEALLAAPEKTPEEIAQLNGVVVSALLDSPWERMQREQTC